MLAILGMNAANSIYACIFCKIPKDLRYLIIYTHAFLVKHYVLLSTPVIIIIQVAIQVFSHHFSCRWDMSKLEDYYWSNDMRRTLEEIFQLCSKKKNHYGCISPPLLNIDPGNVRIDELHLLLRITGAVNV